MHTEDADAPSIVENRPAGQFMQVGKPEVKEYWPAGQLVHTKDAIVENWPAGHVMHNEYADAPSIAEN